MSLTDDVPATTTDVDIQLLEAAKAGDVEVVKVMDKCSRQGNGSMYLSR